MKKWAVEYTLSNGDWCQNVFEGKNMKDAERNFNRQTGVPKSKIISIGIINK